MTLHPKAAIGRWIKLQSTGRMRSLVFMVRATETLQIDAPPERVAELYADVSGW